MRAGIFVLIGLVWSFGFLVVSGLIGMGDCNPAEPVRTACEAAKTNTMTAVMAVGAIGLLCLIAAFFRGVRRRRG